MKNKLLISTALAAAFTVANAYAVEPAQSAVSDVKIGTTTYMNWKKTRHGAAACFARRQTKKTLPQAKSAATE